MRKFLLIAAVVLIIVPPVAYLGQSRGWWTFYYEWDILAHSSVSLGLALGLGLILRKLGIRPSYLNIIIPVVLIGMSWELSELILRHFWTIRYVSTFETFKDVTMDSVGAIIGATVVNSKRG